jgi:NhaA family Na+:H+ antiporter
MTRRSTLEFLKTETGAGGLLALAALAAVIVANSPAAEAYFGFIDSPLVVRVGAFDQTRTVLSWTRDALMAIFFLVVGMEIKFEVLRGEFSSLRRLSLPILAAVGGMVGPALVYLAVNAGPGGEPRGWPIGMPTDVACSLAALAIFGRRLPQPLRVFLLTLAMADDLGAIGLIGLLYTAPIHPVALTGAVVTLTALAALSRWKAAPRLFYAAGFILVWAFTMQSGFNTAVAGFACALTVPIGARRADQESVLEGFMDNLHPYVAFGVLPFFVFVSAGYSFADVGWHGLLSPMPLGVAGALLVGKPLGIMAFSFLGVATRIGRRPLGTPWVEILGVSLLGGAGFTLSFYIGALAFDAGGLAVQAQLRAAVFLGSLFSVLAGGAVLAWAQARRDEGEVLAARGLSL